MLSHDEMLTGTALELDRRFTNDQVLIFFVISTESIFWELFVVEFLSFKKILWMMKMDKTRIQQSVNELEQMGWG